MIDRQHGWNRSFKPLSVGFVLSVILTLAAYRIATRYHLRHMELAITLFSIGTIQALIQMVFFLHLGVENKPHWSLLTFFFTALVIVIVIGGSLWIMANLNYNTMVPMEPKTGM